MTAEEERRYYLACHARRRSLKRREMEQCRVCGRMWAGGVSAGGPWRACSLTCIETLRARERAAKGPA